MTLSADLSKRIRDYLDQVSEAVGDRPESVRVELIRQLESHITEALRQRGGESPTSADLDAILCEMDSPETYRTDPSDGAGAPPHVQHQRQGGDLKWFLLALCFLVLNVGAVWMMTHPRSAVTPTAPAETAKPRETLVLQGVSMASFNSDEGSVILKLNFNTPPVPGLIGKYVGVSLPDKESEVMCEPVGEQESAEVLLKVSGAMEGNEILTVKVRKGLLAANPACAPLAAEQQMTVQVRNGFEVGAIEASSHAFDTPYLTVRFGKRLDVNEATEFIAIRPGVKFDVQPGYEGCSIFGEFQPGKTYQVTFKKGLKSDDGIGLSADVTRSVTFPDRQAGLTIPVEGSLLSPSGALNVPVAAMNIHACEVSLRQVCQGNIVFFANGGGDVSDVRRNVLTGPAVTRKIVLPESPNKENKFYVNLREWTGGAPKGVYHLAVSHEGGNRWERETERLIAVTDLGISAKKARDGVCVWVNSLRTAGSVTNAEVMVFARNNSELGRARTDSNGLAFVPVKPGEAEELAPSLVTAAAADDLSYLALRGAVRQEENAGAAYLNGGNEAFVFTDRGVYRPGETLHAKTLVRDGTMNPPKPFPVVLRVLRPDGEVFRDFPVTLDANGAAELVSELPAYLPTGCYKIEVAMPGTDMELGLAVFSIEEFVPPQIAVSLSNLPARVAADASFDVSVSARHLFGRPASGLPVSAKAVFSDAPFKPAGWDGYQFGDSEKAAVRRTVELESDRLDEEGKITYEVEAVGKVRPAAALKATVSATVREGSGRTVTEYGSLAVDPYPFYVGVKSLKGSGHIRVGEAARMAAVAVSPDGKAFPADGPLSATVERVDWSNIMRRSNGLYSWDSHRVKTKVGDSMKVVLKEGLGEFQVKVDRAGQYLVTVADPFSGASSSFMVFAASGDSEWVDWARDKPGELQMSLDAAEYVPGAKAKLAVRAPFKGEALLTVESDRVLERRRVTLTGNTAEFEIEVKPEYAPNVHCVMSLIRPAVAEKVWSTHRAVGSVSLKVVPPGRRLKVTLDAPAVSRPQTKLAVKVSVVDEGGKPAMGVDVTMAGVDEGICMLTDFETPDPLAYFLRARSLSVILSDLYGELMAISDDTSDATVSHTAGGAASMMVRRLNPIKATRFRPVALWKTGVVTDGKGEATVELDVPEFTGELRVMAVVAGQMAFGCAKRPVTIKRPLVVQNGLPRFLAPTDRCRATLTIFNETGAATEARWRVTCGGPLSVEPAEGVVPLKAGASAMVPMTLAAGTVPGKGLYAVEVTAGAERYAETIELPVRPIIAADSSSLFVQVKPGEQVKVTVPAGLLPGTEFYEARISGRPDVKLIGSLDWLLRYPYGCAEQTVSSAFPLLYLSDLAARVRPHGLEGADVGKFVMAGVYRVLTMQLEDGGFALWPDARKEDPWVSVYATHFLVEAKKAGYAVPEDRLKSALDSLGRQLEEGKEPNRAYICRVLAQAGRPVHGWIARLGDQAGSLSAGDRGHLAAALLAVGKPREALTLLKDLGVPAAGVRRTGYDSRTRDVALALSAWLDIEPENEMVLRLVGELEGMRVAGRDWWGTTQENAMALMALGKFTRLTKPDHSPFDGELIPEGAAAVPFSLKTELRWKSREPGAAKALTVVNRGPGVCWLAVRREGVPMAGEVHPCDEGVSVRREVLGEDGKPLDVSAMKQGDMAVVKVIVDTHGEVLDNLVIEDLLPAGWEVENPELVTSETLEWVKADIGWCLHRELRDDRVLLFSGSLSGAAYYYTVRAVTPGKFVWPPIRVEAMYRPEVRSVNGGGTVSVGDR